LVEVDFRRCLDLNLLKIDFAGGWFACRELLPVLLDWARDESGGLRMQLALPARPWQAFQELASLRPSHTNGCNGR
jgi:hypothetical protein